MKRLTILGSAIALAGGWQLAQAQPPGGGGGGFAQMTFDGINTETEETPDHLTEAEVTTFMEGLLANFGGGRGGGGGFGGGRGGAGGAAGGGDDADAADGGGGRGGARGAGGGRGGRGGGIGGIFAAWDTDMDGLVSREEFDNRQQGRGRGGRGGGGRGGAGGGAQQQ